MEICVKLVYGNWAWTFGMVILCGIWTFGIDIWHTKSGVEIGYGNQRQKFWHGYLGMDIEYRNLVWKFGMYISVRKLGM